MGAVSDRRDVRVLIPRVRRAVDGPTAESPAAVSATLTDNQIKDLIADAVADVILYTGGLFGKALNVTARDEFYQAPTEYQTSEELSLNEVAVITTQTALTYHFNRLRDMKVSERIANEAQEWEYSISANTLRDYLKALQDARDKALDSLKANNAALDSYESFLAVRDAGTSLAIEPWVEAVSAGGGQALGWGSNGWV